MIFDLFKDLTETEKAAISKTLNDRMSINIIWWAMSSIIASVMLMTYFVLSFITSITFYDWMYTVFLALSINLFAVGFVMRWHINKKIREFRINESRRADTDQGHKTD